MHIDDLVRHDRRAVLASVAAVGRCSDLTAPTPCRGWQVADLLAHMTVQHLGFARAVRGELTAVADWQPRPLGNPISGYVEACAEVLGSFAALDEPAAPVTLPEIRDAPVPAQTAVGFHLLDYVVHTWDVAASVGGDVPIGAEVLDAALTLARHVPDGPTRDAPGAAFAHALPVPPGASVLDEILLILGRDPRWPG